VINCQLAPIVCWSCVSVTFYVSGIAKILEEGRKAKLSRSHPQGNIGDCLILGRSIGRKGYTGTRAERKGDKRYFAVRSAQRRRRQARR
jgi:hypothetical protein